MNKISCLAFLVGVLLAGCGGGSASPPAPPLPLSVVLSQSGPQSAMAGQALNISAQVMNDAKAAGVTWSLNGPGALSAQTTTSVIYTAPSPIAANATATITATSISDTTVSKSLTINLQAVAISLTPSTAQTDEQGQTTSVTASISNEPSPSKGVTWSLMGAGALSGQTPTAVTYKSPASITAASTATITATSVFDGTKATALTINLVPPPSVATTTLPQGAVSATYTTTILAATGGVTPYTWTLTSAASTFPPGLTLSSAGVISGKPSGSGTFSFTVQVTDADNFTAIANLSINIIVNTSGCGFGSESLLNGHYAMLLKGFDNATPSPNPALIGGVLTFNGVNTNGLITAGTVDMNLGSGVQTALPVTSGSYSIGSDHRGCMKIETSAGTQGYQFSVENINTSSGVASTGHVIDFDATGPFTTGVLRAQDPTAFSTAQVTGSYAFGLSTVGNSGSGKLAVAGVFNLSGGRITGGEEDINQGGVLDTTLGITTWPSTPISFSGGTYTVDGTNGRGTITTNIGGTVGQAALYVISATEVLVMSTDARTSNGIFAGSALQQSGGGFTSTSLLGGYVGYSSALGSKPGTTAVNLFLFNIAISGSNISGTSLQNDGGTFSQQSVAATYTVSSGGRATIASWGSHAPVLYLVSPNQAFFLGSNGGVDSGFVESQSGGSFTNSSLNGPYAFGGINPESSGVTDQSGVLMFTPHSSSFSGTSDSNAGGSLSPSQALGPFTYLVDAAGMGQTPSGCTILATSTTCQRIFYLVSPKKAVLMDLTTMNPGVEVVDQ